MRVPAVSRSATVTPPTARGGEGSTDVTPPTAREGERSADVTDPADPDGRESVVAAVRTALPLDRHAAMGDFGEANAAWTAAGLELGERAPASALEAAGLAPADVDLLVRTSLTGIAAPSFDARLASRRGMRPDDKRIPVSGPGRVTGAAGLARLHDYLRGHRGDVAVLLGVELCSLTLRQRDDSPADLVASALLGGGGGAAAVVTRTARADDHRPGRPTVVATRGPLHPDTAHLPGWAIGAGGSRPVVDAGPGGRHHRPSSAVGRMGADDGHGPRLPRRVRTPAPVRAV